MAAEKKILITEDERTLSSLMKDKFVAAGFDVQQAFNGEEGLQKALEWHPDLIMLDIIMPKMDGVGMYEALRKDKEWGAEAEVVFLTNLGDEESAQRFKDDPHCDYVLKTDWKLSAIVDMVQQRLEAHDTADDAES